MRIRILGCSGGIGAGVRTSAMLVDDDVLIDAGTGIGDLDLGDLDSIRHVFLTHSHLDHVAGLPMLVDRIFDENFDEPLTVYARKETLQALRDHIFNDVIWPDFSVLPSPDNPLMRYRVCSPGDSVDVAGRKFNAVEVRHTVPALGFTVQNAEGAFAVSGDTRSNATLWPALNACSDLRVLVIEVSFPDELGDLASQAGHYTPETLTADLELLRHTPQIWLTGMKPGVEDTILDQVRRASPERDVQMLSRGTVLTV
jgi:ribonuclease BN (tRNA processing enzyme)